MKTNGRSTRIAGGALKGLVIFIAASSLLVSESKLSVVQGGASSLEIRLANDQSIAGLQFVIRSSSNVALQELKRSGRTSSTSWMVASHRLNDSTIRVVILSADLTFFAPGDGSVAVLSFTKKNENSSSSMIGLADVVAADPQALRVAISIQDLKISPEFSNLVASSADFELGQNYPNPFNPSTKIGYQLKKGTQVRLSVFDMAGREVRRLIDGYQIAGIYNVSWNSADENGIQLPSGAYFARLQVGNEIATRKMLLTK